MQRVVSRGIGIVLLAVGMSAVAAAAAVAQPADGTSSTPPTVVVTGVPTPAPAPNADTGDESGDESGDGGFAAPTLPNPASPDAGPLDPPASTTTVRPPAAAGLDTPGSATTAPAPLPRLLADTPTTLGAGVGATAAPSAPEVLPTTGPGLAGTAGFALVAAGVAIVAAAGRRDLRRPPCDDQAAAT